MKTQFIFLLILGCFPSLLSAQHANKIKELVAVFEESEDYFRQGPICAAPVIIFSKANFRGERRALHRDWSAASHRSPWNDEIASIKVPRGWEAWLYEHADFRGRSLVITGDWSVQDNPRWSNRISSIRMVSAYDGGHPGQPRRPRHRRGDRHRPQWEEGVTIFDKKHFSGDSKTIYDDWSVRYSDDYWNDRISSIYIPSGYVVILYEHADFQGRSVSLQGDWSIQRQQNFWNNRDFWNNRTSSIKILYRR